MINTDKELQTDLFSFSDIIEIGEDPFNRDKRTVFYKGSGGKRCYVWIENLRKSDQENIEENINKKE